MPEAILERAIHRMEEYAAGLAPLKRLNVIYGIGDHLLYGADYLARLHSMGSRVIMAGKPSEPERSVVFFTTSLVGRQDDVVAILRKTRERLEGPVAFVPLVVLDGRLMLAEKFGPRWRGMVMEAKSLFGKVDLATNLSASAVNAMSPRQLVSFAETNGFDEVSINWSPTLGNAGQTLRPGSGIAEWILEFDDLIEGRPWIQTTYRPVVAKILSSFSRRSDRAVPSMAEVVDEIVPETARKSFEIDPSGHILSKFEAVGDVTHAPRHGLPYIGHIDEGPIAQVIERALAGLKTRIMSIHARGSCVTCPHAPVCAGTGFHVATHVGRATGVADDRRDSSGKCPHVAEAVISRIAERMRRNDPSVAGF